MAYTVGHRAWAAWKRDRSGGYVPPEPDERWEAYQRGWVGGYEHGYIEAQRRMLRGETPVPEGVMGEFVSEPARQGQ